MKSLQKSPILEKSSDSSDPPLRQGQPDSTRHRSSDVEVSSAVSPDNSVSVSSNDSLSPDVDSENVPGEVAEIYTRDLGVVNKTCDNVDTPPMLNTNLQASITQHEIVPVSKSTTEERGSKAERTFHRMQSLQCRQSPADNTNECVPEKASKDQDLSSVIFERDVSPSTSRSKCTPLSLTRGSTPKMSTPELSSIGFTHNQTQLTARSIQVRDLHSSDEQAASVLQKTEPTLNALSNQLSPSRSNINFAPRHNTSSPTCHILRDIGDFDGVELIDQQGGARSIKSRFSERFKNITFDGDNGAERPNLIRVDKDILPCDVPSFKGTCDIGEEPVGNATKNGCITEILPVFSGGNREGATNSQLQRSVEKTHSSHDTALQFLTTHESSVLNQPNIVLNCNDMTSAAKASKDSDSTRTLDSRHVGVEVCRGDVSLNNSSNQNCGWSPSLDENRCISDNVHLLSRSELNPFSEKAHFDSTPTLSCLAPTTALPKAEQGGDERDFYCHFNDGSGAQDSFNIDLTGKEHCNETANSLHVLEINYATKKADVKSIDNLKRRFRKHSSDEQIELVSEYKDREMDYDIVQSDSPIDLDGVNTSCEDDPIPIYTISDDEEGEVSDVEFVKESSAASIASENVKAAMIRLHFENVAVSAPKFTRCTPLSADDVAILNGISDIFKEDIVRMKKTHVVPRKPRNILVVVGSISRAKKLTKFFSTHSPLITVEHGLRPRGRHGRPGRHKKRTDTPFSHVFASADLVITTDKAVCRNCQRNLLNLGDVCLIVLDGVELLWDRSHPACRFLRDHYRALPEIFRPRILAIARRLIHPEEAGPIEHNVFSKFVSSTLRGAVWKSCYGRGPRKAEHELLDIEYIHFRDAADESTHNHSRKVSFSKATDRCGFTPLDSVVDEVGPLGVALYRSKAALKRMLRAKGLDSSLGYTDSNVQLGDDRGVLGLTQKMLNLLNELYEAFKASTNVDPLMAIVHAGKPAVACAVCEVINSMPVFSGLVVRVVVGYGRQVGSVSSSHDAFEYQFWQGDDTDDEEVSSFSSCETNVLIVADAFANEKGTSLPPCPLVIRFDESDAIPSVDGCGGRCRVVVFKDHTRRSDPANEADGEIGANVEGCNVEEGFNELNTEILSNRKDLINGEDVRNYCTKTASDLKETLAGSVFNHGPKEFASKEERRNYEFSVTEVYFCRPPTCLIGPSSENVGQVYLYRIMAFGEGCSPEASPMLSLDCGLENFAIVLSERLHEHDTTICLKDYCIGSGNGTSVSGLIKLQYQGAITLTNERLDMAQKYTTRLFTLIDPSFTDSQFFWASKIAKDKKRTDPMHPSFLRRYLILPVISCVSKEEDELCPSNLQKGDDTTSKESSRNPHISRYFCDPLKKKKPVTNVVKADWKSVEVVLSLYDRENHMRLLEPASPILRDDFHTFEGNLLFSSLPHENIILAGKLQHNVSPLSIISRSRKFALNSDGTLKVSTDLAYINRVVATEETIRRQKRATGTGPEIIDLDGIDNRIELTNLDSEKGLAKPKLVPVRWCDKSQTLVPTGLTEYSENQVFKLDCERNILKKRDYWICEVRYAVEYYYNRFYQEKIRILDQSLLLAAAPRRAKLNEFFDIVRGKDITDVISGVVKTRSEKRFLAPEKCQVYPLSSGALFLPCALFIIEQHLSICELRNLFDPFVGIVGNASHLVRAVTPNFKNSKTNYERLEFLGDSLFKLACTTRLMKRLVYEDEGGLTRERNRLVANAVLKKCGERMELYNYFRFHLETDEEWRPPGTDTRGHGRRFQMKSIADVVEALCGAYFEMGVLNFHNSHGAKSMLKKTKVGIGDKVLNGYTDESSSDSESQHSYDSSSDEQDICNEESYGEENTVTGRSIRKRKRSEIYELLKRHQFSHFSVVAGYKVGSMFLERIGALDREEPTHHELLMATIQAMHPRGARRSSKVCQSAFPSDVRVNHLKWEQRYGKLESILGYKFQRRPLLISALTHSSYIKNSGRVPRTETYERLEFLGDAVADFFVACRLYERYPESGPGELTSLKGNVVSNESFARVSVTNGIHNFLDYNSATLATEISAFIRSLPQDLTAGGDGSHSVKKKDYGEVTAPKVLGDIFEAVIGAVYIDSGLDQAWKVCAKLLRESLRINADRERDDMHPCDELVEKVRRVWGILGDVRFAPRPGAGKLKMYVVYVAEEKIATGVGTSTKRARLLAARNALRVLSDDSPVGAQLRARLVEKGYRLRLARQSQ